MPLINLHSGALVEVQVPKAFVFPRVTLHRSLTDIDLLCSVPMMKTHALAQVPLGIKNLEGVFPGMVYQSVRGAMHDAAAKVEPSSTAAAMVAASLMGFQPAEVPTFAWANKAGLGPTAVEEIEIRGQKPEAVRRQFVKPQTYAWNSIRDLWGAKEI